MQYKPTWRDFHYYCIGYILGLALDIYIIYPLPFIMRFLILIFVWYFWSKIYNFIYPETIEDEE